MIHGKPMTLPTEDLDKVISTLESELQHALDADIEILPVYFGPASHGAPGFALLMPPPVRKYFFKTAFDLLGEKAATTLTQKSRTAHQGQAQVLYFPGVTLTEETVNA